MLLGTIAEYLVALGMPSSARTYLIITTILVLSLIWIETSHWAHRTMTMMELAGAALLLIKIFAVSTTMLTLALLPFPQLRTVIASSLAIMGLLTLYRELRRRLRAGDRSSSSYTGGVLVVIQFLCMVLLTVSGIAIILELLLVPARILDSDTRFIDAIKNWVELLATLCVLLTIYYLGFYLVRRLLKSGSFSWIDPPNWRTLLPHLKYTLMPRWGIPPLAESDLADTVRMAYIEHIVGSKAPRDVAKAAKIEPVAYPQRGFTFAVIGDPGEGDESQIAPPIVPEQSALAQQGPANPAYPTFTILSSDIVYPAGELMDYERTLYRPYASDSPTPPLIYGLAGNHDWYNDLKGLMLNFGYAAAHVESRDPQLQQWAKALKTGPWARYGYPWGQLRWNEVQSLRQRYGLTRLGGDLNEPRTHQRLPFFELSFDPVPFVLLAVDTGCIGSVDPIQLQWLETCLLAAFNQQKIIAVVLSEPLYVNGAFADHPGMRQLYELLRRYETHVVIGGDTHAFQHYEARYITLRGTQHIAHHLVNGGGGAYLSKPVDLHWHTPSGMTPLESRFVYRDDAQEIVDQVMLREVFPTAQQLRAKFNGKIELDDQMWGLRRWLIGQEPNILNRGYTNALNHDRSPLLQSLLTLNLDETLNGWRLRITPWFTTGSNNQLEPQEPIDILAPNRANERVVTRDLVPSPASILAI